MKTGIIGIVLVALVILLTGCQESDSQMVRKAQLVGHENLQLKKQLQQKDSEIAALKQQIADMQAETQKQLDETGQSMISMLENLAQTATELEQCKAENEQLKQLLGQH